MKQPLSVWAELLVSCSMQRTCFWASRSEKSDAVGLIVVGLIANDLHAVIATSYAVRMQAEHLTR
jgi:hypothetical protein